LFDDKELTDQRRSADLVKTIGLSMLHYVSLVSLVSVGVNTPFTFMPAD